MKTKTKLLALMIGLSSSTAVMADGFMAGVKPYLVVSAGAVQADLDGYDKEVIGTAALGGGLKFNPSIALEANLIQTEEASFSRSTVPTSAITGVGGIGTGEVGQDTSPSGMSFGLVGFLPAGKKSRIIVRGDVVTVVAKKESSTKTGDFNTGAVVADPIVKSNERHGYLAAGVGIEHRLSNSFYLRGLAQYYISSDDEAPDLMGLNLQLVYAL